MNLNSLLLRLIARSSDSIVAFVIALDAKLDTFLAQNDAQVANLENQIEDLIDDAEAEVERIRAEADAKVLGNLKTVLTK